VLHGGARVADGEIEAVERLGLTVVESAEGPVFPLPCPMHQENRCTVYAERPGICRAYQCKLLRRFVAGEAAWDECLRLVALAKDLIGREALLDRAALAVLCRQHFLNRAQPREVLGP
jgi:Fe-S-cluster containining protein